MGLRKERWEERDSQPHEYLCLTRQGGVVLQKQTRALFHEQKEWMFLRQIQHISILHILTYSPYSAYLFHHAKLLGQQIPVRN